MAQSCGLPTTYDDLTQSGREKRPQQQSASRPSNKTKHSQEEIEAGNTNHSTLYVQEVRKNMQYQVQQYALSMISDSPWNPTVYWITKLNLTPDDCAILQKRRQ